MEIKCKKEKEKENGRIDKYLISLLNIVFYKSTRKTPQQKTEEKTKDSRKKV